MQDIEIEVNAVFRVQQPQLSRIDYFHRQKRKIAKLFSQSEGKCTYNTTPRSHLPLKQPVQRLVFSFQFTRIKSKILGKKKSNPPVDPSRVSPRRYSRIIFFSLAVIVKSMSGTKHAQIASAVSLVLDFPPADMVVR